MAEAEIPSRQCPLWYCPPSKKTVAEQSYMLHEVHCQRNFYRCATCGATMDKRQQEEHNSTAHVSTPCPHCDEVLPAYKLPTHKCRKAPRACTFCQAQIAYEDYVDHVKECGSRTQQCPICHKFIQSWEFEKHVAVCVPHVPAAKASTRPHPKAGSDTKARNDQANHRPQPTRVSAKPGVPRAAGAPKPGAGKVGGRKAGAAQPPAGDQWVE